VSLGSNNTGFWLDCLLKHAPSARESVLDLAARGILIAMSDAADLARRFLAAWEDYLTALLTSASAAAIRDSGSRDGAANQRSGPPGPAAGAAPVGGALGERNDALVELAERLAHLERRLAAVERGGRAA
jgi:hypothetical protein